MTNVLVVPLDVTTARDSHGWNCREVAIIRTLRVNSAQSGARTTNQNEQAN